MPRLPRSKPHPPFFQRRGSSTKQTVFVVVLVVLMVGSLFSVWRGMSGESAPPLEQPLGFQCSLCNEVFHTTNVEQHAKGRDRAVLEKFPDRSADQADCPKCGQKHVGLLMTRCASCEKWFLPQKATRREMAAPEFVPKPPICPHCGTDQNKWREEHLPRK